MPTCNVLVHARRKIIPTCGASADYKYLCPPYNTVYYKGIVKLGNQFFGVFFYFNKTPKILKGGTQVSKAKLPVQFVLIESQRKNVEVSRMFLTYIHEEIKRLEQQRNKKEQ